MALFSSTFIAVYTITLAFIFGTVFASFITCTAGRILAGEDWTKGYSHCDTCGHKLGTLDLFPIISYVALKGKCRYCGAHVPIRCLISEALLGVVFVVIVIVHGTIDAVMARNLALAVLVMGLSFCDIDGDKLPKGFIVSMLVAWLIALMFSKDIRPELTEGVIAAALGAIIIFAVTSKVQVNDRAGIIALAAVLLLYAGIYRGISALVITLITALIFKGMNKKIHLGAIMGCAFLASIVLGECLTEILPAISIDFSNLNLI